MHTETKVKKIKEESTNSDVLAACDAYFAFRDKYMEGHGDVISGLQRMDSLADEVFSLNRQ